jgi:hypothetical protein
VSNSAERRRSRTPGKVLAATLHHYHQSTAQCHGRDQTDATQTRPYIQPPPPARRPCCGKLRGAREHMRRAQRRRAPRRAPSPDFHLLLWFPAAPTRLQRQILLCDAVKEANAGHGGPGRSLTRLRDLDGACADREGVARCERGGGQGCGRGQNNKIEAAVRARLPWSRRVA